MPSRLKPTMITSLSIRISISIAAATATHRVQAHRLHCHERFNPSMSTRSLAQGIVLPRRLHWETTLKTLGIFERLGLGRVLMNHFRRDRSPGTHKHPQCRRRHLLQAHRLQCHERFKSPTATQSLAQGRIPPYRIHSGATLNTLGSLQKTGPGRVLMNHFRRDRSPRGHKHPQWRR